MFVSRVLSFVCVVVVLTRSLQAWRLLVSSSFDF